MLKIDERNRGKATEWFVEVDDDVIGALGNRDDRWFGYATYGAKMQVIGENGPDGRNQGFATQIEAATAVANAYIVMADAGIERDLRDRDRYLDRAMGYHVYAREAQAKRDRVKDAIEFKP